MTTTIKYPYITIHARHAAQIQKEHLICEIRNAKDDNNPWCSVAREVLIE